MSDQGPEPLVLFLSLLLYLGFELSFRSMDFPADITLRKTRMKFWIERSRLFCYSVIKVLSFPLSKAFIFYHITLFLSRTFSKNFFHLLSKIFVFRDANFYMLSHDFQSVKKFFHFLLRFLPFFSQKCVPHVQRILYYHNNRVASSIF